MQPHDCFPLLLATFAKVRSKTVHVQIDNIHDYTYRISVYYLSKFAKCMLCL